MELSVVSIFVYPIKSCRGIAVRSAEMTGLGLARDRQWMVVDPSGQFLTQRSHGDLALIATELDNDALVLHCDRVSAPLRVPLVQPNGARSLPVRVWRDEVEAEDVGPEAAAWLTSCLGADVKLVFLPDDVKRRVDPAYARDGDRVRFADGYPLLVATTASLDDLNSRLNHAVGIERFRPNVVIGGGTPWEEDQWKRVRLGDVPVRVVKPCVRCVVVTADPWTGARGPEPLRTLATFRRDPAGRVLFGQNCIPEESGTLRVGDRVALLP